MMGTLRAQERNWEEAERNVHQALVQAPNFQLAIVQLGGIAEQRGNREQAAEYYAWALRINPTDAVTARRLAELGPVPPATGWKSTKFVIFAASRRAESAGVKCACRGDMPAAVQLFEERSPWNPSMPKPITTWPWHFQGTATSR